MFALDIPQAGAYFRPLFGERKSEVQPGLHIRGASLAAFLGEIATNLLLVTRMNPLA
jgi:hypothetical protein